MIHPPSAKSEGASTSDQSSGREAKSRLAFLYHPIPDTGCFHLPFISFKAFLCASSPLETISFKCLSCAFMTSSAVSPCSGRSHGPPNCLQDIVFIRLASFIIFGRQRRRCGRDERPRLSTSRCRLPRRQHRGRSGLRDADEVARGVAECAVAHSPGLRRWLLEHLGARRPDLLEGDVEVVGAEDRSLQRPLGHE